MTDGQGRPFDVRIRLAFTDDCFFQGQLFYDCYVQWTLNPSAVQSPNYEPVKNVIYKEVFLES